MHLRPTLVRLLISSMSLFLLPCAVLSAGKPSYTFKAVMTGGEAVPTPVSETFSAGAAGFASPALNNSEAVAFRAGIDGSSTATVGVFMLPSQGSPIQYVALDGMTAPLGGDVHRLRAGAHR